MPNLPDEVEIDLQNLVSLLGYYWSSVNSEIGDLGTKSYEETVAAIDSRSLIKITPTELEHLIFHMKQAVCEKLKPNYVDLRIKSYDKIMKNLSNEIPTLFKKLDNGEIVLVDFKAKD